MKDDVPTITSNPGQRAGMKLHPARPIRSRHRPWRGVVGVACVVLALCSAATSSAQPPSDQGNGNGTANGLPADAVSIPSQVGQEIFYVYEGEGENRKLKLVLAGITFEEFERRWKKTDRPAAPPEFVIESLTVAGDLLADYADLKLAFEIEILEKSAGKFVQIPLRLDGAIIPAGDSVTHDDAAEFVLQAGADNKGWTGWLRGEAGRKQTLQLRVFAPVQRVGDRSMLRVQFPKANRSQMTLTAEGNLESEVVTGGRQELVRRSGQKTIVPVAGVAGDFQMTWRKPRAKSGLRKNHLVVEGLQIISVEGDQVLADANLTVKSLVRPFQEFSVKLPPAAQLVSEPTGEGYSIEIPTVPAQGNRPQEVKVTLDEPSSGPVSVRLKTRLAIRGAQDPDFKPIELQFAGFEIPTAVQHSGYIGVQFGDWYHQWKEQGFSGFDIRPVDPALDVFPNKDMFTFQYFKQGYSLKAEISPPQRKIAVAPDYLFDVSEDAVELTARFNYQIQGWGDELLLDPGGWDLELLSSTPAEIVESIADGQSGSKKLVLSRTFKGPLTVELHAKAGVAADEGVISLELPKPASDSPGMTTVVVQPRDNVRLTPKIAAVTAPVFAPFIMPDRQQEPIYFIYDRGAATPEKFEFGFDVNPTVIRAEVDSFVRLSRRSAAVSQTLRYQVLHGREEKLELHVPSWLLDRDVEILEDGQPIELSALAADPTDSTEGSSARFTLPLAEGVSEIELAAEFDLPLDGLSPDASTLLNIPLVMPREEDVQQNRLTLEVAAGLQVEMVDAAWAAVVEPLSGKAPLRSVYQSDGAARGAILEVDLAAQVVDPTVDVKQAWIQTWFTPTARHDYAVFRFESRRDAVEIQLPQGVVADYTEIHLDGQHLPPDVTAEKRLRMELAEAPNTEGDHVLVLRYVREGRAASWGQTTVDMPRFVSGARFASPVFWQLVLPRTEHLLEVPAACVAAFRWTWNRIGLRREPLLTDTDLMRLTGGLSESNRVSLNEMIDGTSQANVYLMRTRDLSSEITFVAVSRSWLVLVSAGVTLAIGLLLIYVPALRNSAVAFSGAVVLVALGFLYPDPVLIFAQLASLGLLLFLLSLLLRVATTLRRRRRPAPIIVSRSSSRFPLTEAYQVVDEPAPVNAVGSTVASPQKLGGPIASAET